MGAGRPGLGELERLAVRSCWERVKDVFLEGSNLDGMPDDTIWLARHENRSSGHWDRSIEGSGARSQSIWKAVCHPLPKYRLPAFVS